MANLYDGVFRTILNDCRKLIIPIINEMFGETYTGEEEIRFFPNEHFLDQQDGADKERITDTNFTIFGKIPKKYHVECESSLPDGKITVRLFEYDAQIALDEGEVVETEITQKYENVQKGVGDMMSGALIETNTRKLKNEVENEIKRETALRMLEDGELSIDIVAKYSGLKVEDVELLAGLQTV